MFVQRMSRTPLPFDELRREMNRLFESASNRFEPSWFSAGRTFPALNVWEDGDNFFAEAEVPGLTMDDLDLQVMGRELTIKGERNRGDGESVTFHRQERGTGSFVRTLTLPAEVDVDKVNAKLHDGVLLLTLPKAAAAKARKIKIKAE